MAIEIKELLIKASVDNSNQAKQQSVPALNNDQLVKQCVEQVLRILERQRNR